MSSCWKRELTRVQPRCNPNGMGMPSQSHRHGFPYNFLQAIAEIDYEWVSIGKASLHFTLESAIPPGPGAGTAPKDCQVPGSQPPFPGGSLPSDTFPGFPVASGSMSDHPHYHSIEGLPLDLRHPPNLVQVFLLDPENGRIDPFLADRVVNASAMTGGTTAPEVGKGPPNGELDALWKEIKGFL